MNNTDHTFIQTEKKQVFNGENFVDLIKPCSVDKGILRFNEDKKEELKKQARKLTGKKAFFVPASGSGSRMFAFLFEFLLNGESTVETRTFFEHFHQFAIADVVGNSFLLEKTLDEKQRLVHFLLDTDKLNLAQLPKGLIPFHKYKNSYRTAFEEQVVQAIKFDLGVSEIHFTVQEEFQSVVESKIKAYLDKFHISFSSQKKVTDAFCFSDDGRLVIENDEPIRRPAGHGALLPNLNDLDADVLLIKNIDNVQHEAKSSETKEMWFELMGVLYDFEEQRKLLSVHSDQREVDEFCDRFGLRYDDEKIDVNCILNRPTRICGMVKNEGEPGGGPFWIRKPDGTISKEIIEKTQIAPNQRSIMEESSHFNPVLIVASKRDVQGNRLDLMNFSDDTYCNIVQKDHNGRKINYRELPGLWNGSMSYWNTIFVEVSSKTFSPVKHVLNLLDESHKA